MTHAQHTLKLRRLGISAYKEAIIYIRQDSYICKAEGFRAQSRINVSLGDRFVIATINMITSTLLEPDEASLSEYAWKLLKAKEGDEVRVSHPPVLNSMGYIRAKIYGHELDAKAFDEIMKDAVGGNLSDIQLSAFISATTSNALNENEVKCLIESMINSGTRLKWPNELVVDKHCIGGLPGNRTTLIVVPIVAAFGLTIPKTSSRAITSSAGTADTMETLAPVALSLEKIQAVVTKENGCIVYGDTAMLCPADNILISVERSLDFDSQSQMVASVLSKKIAAGSTHVLIDIPVGLTTKVRSNEVANELKYLLENIGNSLGIHVKTIISDGAGPVGRGIGPALEAHDVLAVLKNKPNAPQDLKERSLELAGHILEFSPTVAAGTGKTIAKSILQSGAAWKKFQAICSAQGGMRQPPKAAYTHTYEATTTGTVTLINNRYLALVAKLAGAPRSPAAGVYLEVTINSYVEKGQPILTIHAESPGELNYALTFLMQHQDMVLLS